MNEKKNSPNKSSLNDTLCRVMLYALDSYTGAFFIRTELRERKKHCNVDVDVFHQVKSEYCYVYTVLSHLHTTFSHELY